MKCGFNHFVSLLVSAGYPWLGLLDQTLLELNLCNNCITNSFSFNTLVWMCIRTVTNILLSESASVFYYSTIVLGVPPNADLLVLGHGPSGVAALTELASPGMALWCMVLSCPSRVVHTLSSFNLYEDAIEDSRDPHHDDLLAAITEATTQWVARIQYIPHTHIHTRTYCLL